MRIIAMLNCINDAVALSVQLQSLVNIGSGQERDSIIKSSIIKAFLLYYILEFFEQNLVSINS